MRAQPRVLPLLLLLPLLCGADAPSSTAKRILDKAQQILRDGKESTYSHKTTVDESTGRFDLDCSGLVGYILKKVAPAHHKQVPRGRVRPLAFEFYETFSKADDKPAAGKWQRIGRLLDARPGDVLAWSNRQRKPGQSTGHVVVLVSPRAAVDEDTVGVDVIDSTGTGHANDTRAKGQTGVGRGTMYFDVDDAGRPTAFHWRKPNGKPTTMPIAVGRAIGDLSEEP